MTTATRRLRRTGVAGFAASVTAGVAIFATATSAFATLGTVIDRVEAGTATTIYPGTTAQGVGNADINLTNAFNIGDTLLVTLPAAGCATTNGAVGFSAAPTVTASGPTIGTYGTGGASTDASSTSTPTFTTALQSSAGACTVAGVKDQALITFTNSATGSAADNFELVLTNQKVNVGSAAAAGALNEGVTPSNGTATPTSVVVATVSNTKFTVPEASAAPSATAVPVTPITISEVTAGSAFAAGANAYTLTLAHTGTVSSALFTAGVTPTITVPAGYTVTPAATTASTTYGFTVTGPATPVVATVTVAGLTVDVGTGTGTVTLAASKTGVSLGPITAIAVNNQTRIGGIDRYATAAQLFGLNSFTGGTNHVAVISSGTNYPDALSANYLAAGLNGGSGTRVLLTDPNSLPQASQQALITAGITTVYIVGGTAAVSANVQNSIAALHVSNDPNKAFLNVIRIGGADRYDTNSQVDLFNGASGVTTAIVAVGSNFADALAVAPVVVNKKYPLVLTDSGSLNAHAQSTLVNLGIKNVIIVGGTAAVSAATEAAIKALPTTISYRIAGADRTLTASSIATWETTGTGTAAFPATSAYAALNGLGLSATTVYIARGDDFADALAAGTVAGGVGGSNVGAVVLTGGPASLGAGIPAYFSGKANTITTLDILGLTGAVSTATAAAAVASLS